MFEEWSGEHKITSIKYTCGYCGNLVASDRGYYRNIYHGDERQGNSGYISICPHCGRPSFFDSDGSQVPGPSFGSAVEAITDPSVDRLYQEARSCITSEAFTASALCRRKLLMNIAVAKGAKADQNFIDYVEFLSSNGYIPPDAKVWVDHIRVIGNEATHQIDIVKREDAVDLLRFSEMLLRIIFEFPARIQRRTD